MQVARGSPAMTRLLNIQCLRAMAALFVVVFHCGLEMSRIAAATGQGMLFDHGRWGGGVALFFTISGFIMVVTCHDAFGRRGEAIAFLRRRLIRIVPIYWLLTLIMAAVALASPALLKSAGDNPLAIPYSLLFWPFARPDGDVRPLVTPGWTLNLEVYFYAIFALGLLFRRLTGLALVIGFIVALCILRMNGIVDSVPLRFWGDPIVLGFILGMTVGMAYMRGIRLPGVPALALFAAGLALSLTGGVRSLPEDTLLARLSISLPATLILAGAALGPQVDATRWRWLIAIGDASYSLYLVHEFLLRPLRLGWTALIGDNLPLWLFLPLGVMLSIAGGMACYRILERPMGNWLASRSDNRLPRAPALAK